MSVTIHTRLPQNTDYVFIKDTKCMKILFDININNLEDPKDNLVSFISDEEKIFLKVPPSHYHCIYDFMGIVFHLYEKNPNILFILDIGEGNIVPTAKTTIDFCLNLIKENNIKHKIVSFAGKTEFNINNFYIKGNTWSDLCTPQKILKYANGHIKNPNVIPFRKVYISRKTADDKKMKHYGNNFSDKLSRNSYARIDDEEKLEYFFASNGFEVIRPENFESFDDQLNYFYETKTAVSLTGGGLTNIMFMQNGGVVVELVTTLITNYNDRKNNIMNLEEGQHHYYHSISFQKDHEYIGVINKETNADSIIKKFETIPHLKTILG